MGNTFATIDGSGVSEQGFPAPKKVHHSATWVPLGEIDTNMLSTMQYMHGASCDDCKHANVHCPIDLNHVECNPLQHTCNGLDEATSSASTSSTAQNSAQGSNVCLRACLVKPDRGFLVRRFRRRNRTSTTTPQHSNPGRKNKGACLPGITLQFMTRGSASQSYYRQSARNSGHSSSSLRHQPSKSIGYPSNFQHTTHVEVDDTSASDFIGLPRDWDIRLMKSVLKHDKPHNPEKVYKNQGPLMQPGDHARLVRSSLRSWAPKFMDADPLQTFERVLKIGEGVSCSVYSAYDPKRDVDVAVKCFVSDSPEDIDRFNSEIAVMSSAFHRNLIKCYSAYKTGEDYFIVMELADAACLRDVLDFLSDRQMHLIESEIAYICREVLHGLVYMHDNKLVHRDIKSGNTLLTRDGQVKIAGFGCTAQLTEKSSKRNSFVGTPFWMEPEVCLRLQYDYKVDVWSTGVLAIECAEGTQRYAMFLTATEWPPRLKVPHEWSREFNDFIAQCTLFDPAERPSAAEMLKHPFLQCAAAQDRLARIFSVVVDFREQRREDRIQWLTKMLQTEDVQGPITPDLTTLLATPFIPAFNRGTVM